MKHILDTLRDLIPIVQKNFLTDAEFFGYLEKNPQLYALVSSALREGNVSEGNLLINHPSYFDRKTATPADMAKVIEEAMDQLRYFARWLVTARKKHSFTVLGDSGKAAAKPKTTRPVTIHATKRLPAKKAKKSASHTKASGRITTCDQIPERHKTLRRFCRKIGTLDEAKRIIQRVYDEEGNQEKAGKKLSSLYHMRIGQHTVSAWMLLLHLKCKPQFGGRRLLLMKGNLEADAILRKKKKMGLVAFLRQGRAESKTWNMMAREISKITRVTVYGFSLQRAGHRAKIR